MPLARSVVCVASPSASELRCFDDSNYTSRLRFGCGIEAYRHTYLGEYLPDWLAACRNIRPNTARDYSVSIHKHISPRLGNVRLQSLDRLQIRGLYRKLAESGLSEKMVHNVHICLHKALQDAVDDGLLRRNPAERAHAKPKDRPEMKTWSADELAAFPSLRGAGSGARPVPLSGRNRDATGRVARLTVA